MLEETWFDEYSTDRYYSIYEDRKLIIPENAYGKDVIGILFSSNASEFQVSDTNKYLKCVDNIIFDKSGEILLSYARYDDREQYTAPDGTEEIYDGAMIYCWNIKEVYLPKSVKEIEPSVFRGCSSLQKVVFDQSSEKLIINWYAFSGTPLLEEVILPSFSVSIDAAAFGYESRYMLFGFDNEEKFWAEYGGWGGQVLPGDSFCRLSDVKLTTYAQPTLTSEGTTIRWEEIEGATYYEVYQKLNDGKYRLLGTTSGGGCRFTTLKEGKEYTFAVKAYAEIPAANYDPETDDDDEVFLLGERVPSYRLKETYDADLYPESFLIEGTMSEDIVLVG